MYNLNCQISAIPPSRETCRDVTRTFGCSVFGKGVCDYFPLSKL